MKLDYKAIVFTLTNQVKTKRKRSSPKIEEFLPPKVSEDQKNPKIIQRSDADHSQVVEGDADANHSQIIGGIKSNYWGDISPIAPRFWHP